MELNKYEIRRTETKLIEYDDKIITSKGAEKILREIIEKDTIEVQESFWIFYLNRANKIIGYSEISKGGIGGTVVDIKLIAFQAINLLSSSIIMIHNHPSGQIEPSNQDKQITQKIKTALNTLEIDVLDHIIISIDNYYSFLDNGIL